MSAYEIDGTYGTGNEATIFVCETEEGNYYCVEGSHNVNATWEDLDHGVDIETLEDHDHFTLSDTCDSTQQFNDIIDDHLKPDTRTYLTLEIDSQNEAFEDDAQGELVRILEDMIKKVQNHDSSLGRVLDINGNTCGSYDFDLAEEV